MDGEVAQEMNQAVENRSKAGFRMWCCELFGAKSAHHLTNGHHRLIQIRQYRFLGRRVSLGEFPLSLADICTPTKLGAHVMIQIAGQVQNEMANRVAWLQRLRPEFLFGKRLGHLPNRIAQLLKLPN